MFRYDNDEKVCSQCKVIVRFDVLSYETQSENKYFEEDKQFQISPEIIIIRRRNSNLHTDQKARRELKMMLIIEDRINEKYIEHTGTGEHTRVARGSSMIPSDPHTNKLSSFIRSLKKNLP